jgi:hypothetical protein
MPCFGAAKAGTVDMAAIVKAMASAILVMMLSPLIAQLTATAGIPLR